jgi:uncharacterized protein (TIGR00290 family)
MARVFVSWSGGKDSCLACYKAMCEGHEVSYLLNMVDKENGRSRSHGVDVRLISAQAEAMSVPILQIPTSWERYEADFKSAASKLKGFGIEAGVFGDINLTEHRGWTERVCKEIGIEPLLPLWGNDAEDLLLEFIDAGFKAIVVAAEADLGGILGEEVDIDLVDELKKRKIDPCGENGEFHTFVIDGPIFKKRIDVTETHRVLRDDRWFLEIEGYSIHEKRS